MHPDTRQSGNSPDPVFGSRASNMDSHTERGAGLTPEAIWHSAKAAAKGADTKNLAPHNLRRTCTRFCRLAGEELLQIQFLLGHASVQTTVISDANRNYDMR
jgi:integrase